MNLGLGFGYEEVNSGNVVAIWDVNRGQRLHSFLPAVFSSAGMNNEGNVLLSGPWASGNGCAIDSANMRSAQASRTACIVKPHVFSGSAHYATYSTVAGVILSSGVNRKGNILLSGYDRRVGREILVICAEWRWRQMGRVVVFNYGEMVYGGGEVVVMVVVLAVVGSVVVMVVANVVWWWWLLRRWCGGSMARVVVVVEHDGEVVMVN
ncbi:hypothetical protein RHMOL_Rhmol12G0094000 [Rhododendron molle]|uniref:Uncharacterized protein n=1 Tax=Rhododendron molle TaxID=49168 RepID=A0ACC0LH17_RHOML|nr:hypothetical protein RHMOL_Rhmol12G0094000 [Rhododendron molle]